MQRSLVMGGAGLIGSHLVDRLLARGDEVIAIDDLSRGSYANIAHLKREPRFVFMEHDVTVPFRAEVTSIFHLVIPSTRLWCEQDPMRAAATSVAGTMNALAAASANGARLVLMTSTERWGEGARCAESVAADVAKSRGVDVRTVRMPAAYGPRMMPDANRLVSSLVLQALRGEHLQPRARLDRRVRVVYVDDAVETLVRTMDRPNAPRAVIAPSCEASVVELAHTIAEAAGLVGVDVTDASSSASDGPPSSIPMSGRPSLADALPASIGLDQTSWVDLPEGLARTFEWFEARLGRRPDERPSGIFTRDTRDTRDTIPTPAPSARRFAG